MKKPSSLIRSVIFSKKGRTDKRGRRGHRDQRHSCGSYDDVFNLDADVCVLRCVDSTFAGALHGSHHPHPDTERHNTTYSYSRTGQWQRYMHDLRWYSRVVASPIFFIIKLVSAAIVLFLGPGVERSWPFRSQRSYSLVAGVASDLNRMPVDRIY